MPVMHLNVETITEVKDLIAKDQTFFDDTIKTLTEAVHALEDGAWVGNSATQFFLAYESRNADWKRQLEIMRILAERLKQEIEEWQNAADKFG